MFQHITRAHTKQLEASSYEHTYILPKSIIKSICISTDGGKWFKASSLCCWSHAHVWPNQFNHVDSLTAGKLIMIDYAKINTPAWQMIATRNTMRCIDIHACARVNIYYIIAKHSTDFLPFCHIFAFTALHIMQLTLRLQSSKPFDMWLQTFYHIFLVAFILLHIWNTAIDEF